MKKLIMTGMIGTMLLAGCSQQGKQELEQDSFDYTVEQFADLQLLRYKVHGFEELPLEQKKLVWLEVLLTLNFVQIWIWT